MNVSLKSDSESLNKAFRTALGDLAGNIAPWPSLLDGTKKPVILAGLEYDRPWTRDAAINVWNGAGLIDPAVARQTLEAVLIQDKKYGIRIGGQYWDAIIWVSGSWEYYLQTEDREFLKKAYEVSRNSLSYFKDREWDEEKGLFRGAPCYADGISAYPVRYTNVIPQHDIQFWPDHNPDQKIAQGEGLPIMALSTNCLYYNACKLLPQMTEELQIEPEDEWLHMADRLRSSINYHFWMKKEGRYRYFIDHKEGSDLQEGLGHSFALLLGAADQRQIDTVLENQYRAPAGIPCLYPVMTRYSQENHCGRHNGTVWPPIQAFWADAALQNGREDLFFQEWEKLTEAALRDGQFGEVFHPETGLEYGGLQEDTTGEIKKYFLCHRQTWSATAYLRMVLFGIAGLKLNREGLTVKPCLPTGCNQLNIEGLIWRNKALSVRINSSNTNLKESEIRVNGKKIRAGEIITTQECGLDIEVCLRSRSAIS